MNKKLREMGYSYITHNGTPCPDREVKESCQSACVHECSFNFNKTERTKLHKHFWSLTTHEKRIFFSKYINRVHTARKQNAIDIMGDPKRLKRKRKHDLNFSSRRTYSYYYHFDLADKRLQVCKTFFLNTLDIAPTKVYWYFDHYHDEETGGPKPIEFCQRKSKKVHKHENSTSVCE